MLFALVAGGWYSSCPIESVVPAPTYNFGDFELDTSRFELRRDCRALRVERIPLELLILLVEKDGQVVSRQEIIERLWGKDVFVDTEHGINTAIRKIRTALREDVERPRFIQTVSGKGYRFGPETANANGNPTEAPADENVTAPSAVLSVANAAGIPTKTGALSGLKWLWLVIGFLIVGAGLWAFNVAGLRDRVLAKRQIGPIHSIAVLPLVNLSGEASQDYYADGMTDELITALARNRSLRVVSRTSAMQYKGVNKSLRDIAQSLGVDGILEGSVNRSANHVHVNLQLIYAPTDTHVWAQSYDRDLNAAMSLPEDVSQMIAAEAKAPLSPAKVHHSVNPEAHDAYLQGRYFWFAHNRKRSLEFFEKAVKLQPGYAAAWDGIGDAYTEDAGGDLSREEGCTKGEEGTRKALELDDTLPEAHNSMAAVYLFCKWDWRNAEVESLRALESNPNYAEGRFIHAQILIVMNRENEALEEQKQSNDISPFERPWGLGFLYMHLRQYDNALHELRLRVEVAPRDAVLRGLLSEVYWHKGMWNESEQELEKALQLSGENKMAEGYHRAFQRGGEKAVEQFGLSKALESARKKYVSPYDIAQRYAFLGDKQQTLRYLEAASRERNPWLVFLQREPVYDFLHSEERYRAIVRGIGLPPAY
jgi:TolB-like protein/DNA-binding winged helix-turn-helix (wHTH) protein/Flp pilus assembly protein TadD